MNKLLKQLRIWNSTFHLQARSDGARKVRKGLIAKFANIFTHGEFGFSLHKGSFVECLVPPLWVATPGIPVYGETFSVQHALSCCWSGFPSCWGGFPSIHCNKLRAYRSLTWHYCITQSTNSARWSYHEFIWKCQPQYCSEWFLEQPLQEDLYSHDIARSTSISSYYRKCEDEKKRIHICHIKHSLFTLLVFVPQGEWPKATVTIYFM